MRFSGLLCGLVLVLGLSASCSTVSVKHPFESVPGIEDLSYFEGVWVGEEGAVWAKAREEGFVSLAWLEWDESQFRMHEWEMTVSAGYLFISAVNDSSGEHMLLRYRELNPNEIVVWESRKEPFVEAIGRGRLQGTTGDHVVIESDAKTLLDFVLDSEECTSLFDYEEPMVFRKTLEGHYPTPPPPPVETPPPPPPPPPSKGREK